MRSGHRRPVWVPRRVQLPVKANVHTCVGDFNTDADVVGAVVRFTGAGILPDGHTGSAGVTASAIERAALINRSVAVDYDMSENAVVLCSPAAHGAISRKSFCVMDDDTERREG